MKKETTAWKRTTALFLIGQSITLFGSMLVHYAIMWHITLDTQSGVMMTLIAIAGAVPMFLISPFSGVWADRYNKKHIINIADAIIAVVTLIMAIVFSLGIEHAGLLLICLVMRAFGQGVQMPAVNALIPEIVPHEHLTRVNGISGSIQSIVMFASPMAGGALLAVAPIQTLLLIDVVTAIIGIALLLFFVKTPTHSQKEIKAGAKQYFLEIGEGLKYVSKQLFLKKFFVLAATFNFMAAPASILTQLQVVRDFGDGIWNVPGGLAFGPEQRLAVFNVIYFAGMILGGLIMGLWGGFKNKNHTMALSVCLFGIGSVGLGLIANFWLYLLCVGLIGLVGSLFRAPMMATLQTNVDVAYMGRVFSVLMMMSSLMTPLGMVLWGPLGDIIAIDWILMGTGGFIFLIGVAFATDKTLLKADTSARKTENKENIK